MLKVDLPPEYNNWAEVLNEKYRGNKEIGQLNLKLTAAKERERVLREALKCIQDGETFKNKIYPFDIARAALAQVKGGKR